MALRVRNTETGDEFNLEADCFTHGVASYRLGQNKDACPFNAYTVPDYWKSWMAGWETAERIRHRNESSGN